MAAKTKISVIGLGYVGLPLAVAMARHYDVVGYDSDAGRIAALEKGLDRTGEVEAEELAETACRFTAAPEQIAGADVFIVTVPTPVDAANVPDLSAIRAACETVGRALAKGAVVVFESTVYPGVTEEICGPALEAASGLAAGRDFFLGYAPERMNPGDRDHGVERIVKVVSGQTPEVAARLEALYGRVTAGGVFVARNIKTAEAAKVIENAQRDINIAFVNEITMIFGKLGISVYDVLAAARTKWNFLDFRPGLVGGHCIGIDPFYLAHLAQKIGHHPEIILAGRRINDGMGAYLADAINVGLGLGPDRPPGPILVLGVTFKENVPDIRNSKVVDMVAGLRDRGHRVDVHDPHADPAEAKAVHGVDLMADLAGANGYQAVVGAVCHDAYRALDAATLAGFLTPGGLVADIKGMWRELELPDGIKRWQL